MIKSILKREKTKTFSYLRIIIKKIFIISLILLSTITNITFNFKYLNIINSNKKRIGVIGLSHSINVGNMLLKYAISIKLKALGFQPSIIGKIFRNTNTSIFSFLSQFINLRIIKTFDDIKPNEYDILMVNSDQTWRNWHNKNLAFLKFSQNWSIKRFVYATSITTKRWSIPSNIAENIKILLKNFTGISVRENGSIPLIEKNLGIKPLFVLDPTLLIDKKYYLNLINDYKSDFEIQNKYICNYKLNNFKSMNDFLIKSSKELKYRIVVHDDKIRDDYIQRFLYCIDNSQAVITDSFHGTVFSIIFNKSFVSFQFSENDERFNSLIEIFGIKNRIITRNNKPNISILATPLNIDFDKFYKMRDISNKFLKEQLYF